MIREHLRKRGLDASRDNLIAAGNALRRRYGADILARRVLKKVQGKAVIDSIRNGREVACLKKQPGFVLAAVDAPVEIRFKRAENGAGRSRPRRSRSSSPRSGWSSPAAAPGSSSCGASSRRT